jgi:ketosteroid isomerase-like protein
MDIYIINKLLGVDMRTIFSFVFLLSVLFFCGCGQQQEKAVSFDENSVKKEVESQFNQLILEINKKDALKWAEFYSSDNFVSACVMTDCYSSKEEWVALVKDYFGLREKQLITPTVVEVTALGADYALLSSRETTEMSLKDGSVFNSNHSFTMIWKKEKAGWKVIHSHEAYTPLTR